MVTVGTGTRKTNSRVVTAKLILERKNNNNQPNKNREGPSDRRYRASPSPQLLPPPPPPSTETPSRAIVLSTFRTSARRSLSRRPGNRLRTGDGDGGNNNSDSGGGGGGSGGHRQQSSKSGDGSGDGADDDGDATVAAATTAAVEATTALLKLLYLKTQNPMYDNMSKHMALFQSPQYNQEYVMENIGIPVYQSQTACLKVGCRQPSCAWS